MKSSKLLVLAACGCLISVLVGSPSYSAEEKPLKLRLATWCSKSVEPGQIFVWWAEEVKKRTNGRLQVDLYFDQSLCTTTETLKMTSSGAIDIGGCAPGYHIRDWPQLFALYEGLDFNGHAEFNWVLPRAHQALPMIDEELRKLNVIRVCYGGMTEYGMLSTKPIRNLADLKGKRARSWGSVVPKYFSHFGAVPVNILMAEAYEGLAKGLLDITPNNMPTVTAAHLYESAKYFTYYPVFSGAGGNFLVMNLKVWNGLPSDIKQILLKIMEDNLLQNRKFQEKWIAESKAEMEKNGVQFIAMPEQDAKTWRELIQNLGTEQVMSLLKGLNLEENGKKILETRLRLAAEYQEFLKTPAGKEWLNPK
jgi:TRAP-type C4-dicarboxylate transport system substrate-binding protein